MKLSYRLAIQTTLLTLVTVFVLMLFIGYKVRQHGFEEAELRARLLLRQNQAMLDFVVQDLRPRLTKLHEKYGVPASYFDPTWMSASYLTSSVMKYFRKDEFADYSFKDAAVNARGSLNEADEFEKSFLEKTAKDPQMTEWAGVVQIDGKPFFLFMQKTSTVFSRGCMQCHSTPEKAPAGLVDIYGTERSFGKQVGDIPSVLSVRIPMKQAQVNNYDVIIVIACFTGVFLPVIFLLQFLFTRWEIVNPIKRISQVASAIANDDSRLGDGITVRGAKELVELGNTFSEMSERLAENKNTLEQKILQRTRELFESEKQYRLLFEKMLDGFAVHEMIYDDSGIPNDYKFIRVNPQFEKQTGLSGADIIGKNVREVLPDIEPFWIQLYGKVVETGEVKHFESYSRALDRFFEVTAFKVGDSKFATLFKDITERVETEEKTNQLEEQLKQAHKMEAIGTMAGGIAHDFNNILAGILGYAELIEDEIPGNSQAKKDLQDLIESVLLAKKLIQQILMFSRKSKHSRIPLDMALRCKEVLPLLRASIPSTIEIREDIRPACGMVMADPTQMNQVIINLCTNAAQAIRESTGHLDISLDCIELEKDAISENQPLKPGRYQVLTVRDNGVGIQPQHLERIFDPYFTTKDIDKGSGMGLAVVHGIVRDHEGMVTVESTPGKGSTFCVYLPVMKEG